MMFKNLEKYFVAGFQLRCEAMSEQGDRGSGSICEDNLLIGIGVEETRDLAAGMLIGVGCCSRSKMLSLVHIGPRFNFETPQSA